MIFDRLCEIDLEIDDDSDFDVEYEPIADFDLEPEYEHEYEPEYEGVDELLRGHEQKVSRVSELAGESREAPLAAGREETRAERSDGETGTTSTVQCAIRSRSATEGSTPENPGGAGGSFLVRSESRLALLAAGREMENPVAARRDASGHPSSLDPTGGDDV